MGIIFEIGQAIISTSYGDVGIDILRVPPVVIEGIENLKPQENYIDFSYSGFEDFKEKTDTRGLFEELAPYHPYDKLLERKHLDMLNQAIERFKAKNPNATPKYYSEREKDADGFDINDPETWWKDDSTTENADLATLLRFRFWMEWALNYCNIPTFANR